MITFVCLMCAQYQTLKPKLQAKQSYSRVPSDLDLI